MKFWVDTCSLTFLIATVRDAGTPCGALAAIKMLLAMKKQAAPRYVKAFDTRKMKGQSKPFSAKE